MSALNRRHFLQTALAATGGNSLPAPAADKGPGSGWAW
jgi:hypothetical protein